MKQSVEKQVKVAFDRWDEKASDSGFDKQGIWASMKLEHPAARRLIFTRTRVAAAIVIAILAGGWLNAMYTNRQLQQEQRQLTAQFNQLKENHTSTERNEKAPVTETKIVYKTRVKEVQSSQSKQLLTQLAQKYNTIENENKALQAQINLASHKQSLLNDSIQILMAHLQKMEEAYTLQLQALEKTQRNNKEINIDQAALLALSKSDQPTTSSRQPAQRRFQLTLKNKLSESESTAPLIRDIR